MPGRLLLALALCSPVFCSVARAQECTPPPIVANAKTFNLFSPEQEMIFGELTLENRADNYRFIRDEKLLAYVNEVGARLVKHLPQVGLRYRFHLIDMPEANAFNTPGGHVFLSRKLVAFVKNEDELAGVMAHELGHAVVRHTAADMSEVLRKVLGVTSLGDRKDITEKYNLLIERARTKSLPRREGHENEQQLEADRVGLYAMVAAGYDPAAFAAFFDRLTESEGKRGSWFSELFGTTRPAEKRLREMVNATEKMAPACREGRSAKATEVFLKWQADVVSFRDAARREELPGLLWKKELAPKLRSDISHLSFSPDGRLLLAQDDFAITVIEREPLRVLFQIPVEKANEATFTPDGRAVVFITENLRYEKWSVADGRPVEVRELVLRQDCWEHKLSPDGAYLACVDTATTVNVLDTRTGKKVWEKKEFYPLTWMEFFSWLTSARGDDDDGGVGFFRIEFSPDSRYVVFSRSEKFRFRIKFDLDFPNFAGSSIAQSKNTALALDLTTLKPADLGGDLKKIAARPYVFLDPERIVGSPSAKVADAGVFSFPKGKRLQKFEFAAKVIKRTANPDYVIIKPLANAPMGVYDLKRGVVAGGFFKQDGTLWNNLMAYESVNGKLLLREVSYNEKEGKLDGRDVGTVEIPVSSIRNLNAAEVSNAFNWLLLSSKTRGGLWNLETGERKFYMRGFKGGVVANDGGAVADFSRLADTPHSLVVMNPLNDTVAAVRELPEKGARQYGRFVLLRSPLVEQKEGEAKGETLMAMGEEEEEDTGLRRAVRFELKDFLKDKVIWSRDFPKEAPQFSFDEFSGRLIFYWSLGGEAGKAKLSESPELQAKANALGNRQDDYLVEVLDAFAQKTVGTLLLETGKGSFDVGEGMSEGNWLVLYDSRGRVLVFSLKDGGLRHRFFGHHAAVSPQRNQIAVENFPGEVTLYDLETGERRANFVLNGSAAFVRFNLDGSRLFVLSDAQSAYAFDLNKTSAQAAQQAR